MRTLNVAIDSFDRNAMFTVALVKKNRTKIMSCSLHSGYEKEGDGVMWALQHGAVLKSHYTAADIAHSDRMNSMAPLNNGDVVMIEGKQYKVRVKGDYSDCAMFDPVEDQMLKQYEPVFQLLGL
jgi:hypothetical protein